MYLLIANATSKDSLSFSGYFKGHHISKILLTNRCVEAGVAYLIQFNVFEISDNHLIISCIKVKAISSLEVAQPLRGRGS